MQHWNGSSDPVFCSYFWTWFSGWLTHEGHRCETDLFSINLAKANTFSIKVRDIDLAVQRILGRTLTLIFNSYFWGCWPKFRYLIYHTALSLALLWDVIKLFVGLLTTLVLGCYLFWHFTLISFCRLSLYQHCHPHPAIYCGTQCNHFSGCPLQETLFIFTNRTGIAFHSKLRCYYLCGLLLERN